MNVGEREDCGCILPLPFGICVLCTRVLLGPSPFFLSTLHLFASPANLIPLPLLTCLPPLLSTLAPPPLSLLFPSAFAHPPVVLCACVALQVSGCFVLLPWSYYIWQQIQDFFNPHLRRIGVDNCYFPMFVTQERLQREKVCAIFPPCRRRPHPWSRLVARCTRHNIA